MGRFIYTNETFKEKVLTKWKYNFSIISEYKSQDEYITIKCEHCGNERTLNAKTLLYNDNLIWCVYCCKDSKNRHINEQMQKIRNSYPMKFSDALVLYLDHIEYIEGKKAYKIDIHDNEGYKYCLEYGSVETAKNHGSTLNRFFKRNKYTSENIQNFLNKNDINMKLLTTGLYSGNSREKIEFLDKNNNIQMISWNEIKSKPEKYKDNYYDVLNSVRQSRLIDKKTATQIILNMQSELNRPLCQTDFENIRTSNLKLGIRVIYRIWGTFVNMQNELNLNTNTNKFLDNHQDYIDKIIEVCNKVYKNENRRIISYKDFRKIYSTIGINTFSDHCAYEGYTLRTYIESLGFELQQSGNGFNYKYDNGEKVVSMYEYEFSNYLRKQGLIYNKDYFRDVRYDKLSTEYKGNMNCDYEIHFQGRIFYVELAGMLSNVGHEKCYKENISINSKSKEKYRLDLMKKKSIFEQKILEHYILLKSDMSENTYKNILNNCYQEVA